MLWSKEFEVNIKHKKLQKIIFAKNTAQLLKYCFFYITNKSLISFAKINK